MTTLVLNAFPNVAIAEFANHPRVLIRQAVEERCDSLGLPVESRRVAVDYALSLYPDHSHAWCISQGTTRAHQLARRWRVPVINPEPPKAA